MAKQTKVAQAVSAAFVSAKDAKKAGPVVQVQTQEQRIANCIGAFTDFLEADKTLADAKEAWNAARMGLRAELEDARAQWKTPKEWGAFLKALNPALVSAGIVNDVKAARKLVNNQLQALNLLGGTERAGAGRKKGAGRKEKVSFTAKKGAVTDAENVQQALAYIKSAQKTHADDSDILQVLADIAKILRFK